jgi:Ca2+-binding RTX toxin-like protein
MASVTAGDLTLFMNGWTPSEMVGGAATTQTANAFDFESGGGATSDGPFYDFAGAGFTYQTTAGFTALTGGTITSFSSFNIGSDLLYTVSGLHISAHDFLADANLGVTGFETAIFAGADTITGTAGSDVLAGYGGNDVINGAAGIDNIDGGPGNDQVNGGDDNDVLAGGAGNDIVHGDNGDDHIDGGSGNNKLYGDAGDDTFVGGTGNNAYDGGDGNDTVNYSALTKGVKIDMGKTGAQAIGGGLHDSFTNIETIVATHYNDVLTGGPGDDDFIGNGGNDTFHLEAGGNDATTEAESGGSCKFYMGAAWNAGDDLGGGFSVNTMILDGDYSAARDVSHYNTSNIQKFILEGGHSYDFSGMAGQSLDASALGVGDTATISGEFLTMTGGAGNDVLTDNLGFGTKAAFHLEEGGNDTATGSDGDDVFYMGASYTAADHIDGGADSMLKDVLDLNGNYAANQQYTANDIGEIVLHAGHSYNFTAAAGIVSDHPDLVIAARALGAADALTFDGSALTDILDVQAGAGNDTLTGGAGADLFDLTHGGNDHVSGGAGNDVFTFGSTFNASDSVDGGAGTDTLKITNVIAANLTLDPVTGNIHGVESLDLGGAQDFHIVVDAGYAASITLAIDNDAGHVFTYDGRNVTGNESIRAHGTGSVTMGDGGGSVYLFGGGNTVTGGAGNDTIEDTGTAADTISTGAGNDSISAGTGNDVLDAGAGNDRIFLGGGFDSVTTGTGNDRIDVFQSYATGSGYATITDFDAHHDKFVFFPFFASPNVTAINAVDPTVTHGRLDSGANMNADLLTALGTAQLGGEHAVVFTPDSGTLAGHSFLVVSSSSTAGYQTGDFVIELGGTSSTALTLSNFEI